MKMLFDTSVLIPAIYRAHEFHSVTGPWLAAAKSGDVTMLVAAHTLAEFYATVTRMPAGWKSSPSEAIELLRENVLDHAVIRTLPATGYVRLLSHLESRGLFGGVVYDGVVAEVARREKVDGILTLNPRHFERVWPDDTDKIIDPRTTQPPTPPQPS